MPKMVTPIKKVLQQIQQMLQDFKSMSDFFWTLCIKVHLRYNVLTIYLFIGKFGFM